MRVAKTKTLISFAVTAREADLRLCFRLCRSLVFPRDGSYVCSLVNGFLYVSHILKNHVLFTRVKT